MILATRGSALALSQADIVKKKLEALGISVQLLAVSTKGDRDRLGALKEIGGNGLFIRELEKKLLNGEADVAVHSGKDLPYMLAEGLCIGCVPDAADPRDCLIRLRKRTERPQPVIGTGSPRRMAEYAARNPEAVFRNIRGNIDTRLKKLEAGEYDGIILAAGGMERLSLSMDGYESRCFSVEEMIPAPCQGLLAVECRERDSATRKLLQKINDAEAAKRFVAERMLFRRLKADCTKAIGIHAVLTGNDLTFYVLSEGKRLARKGTYQQLPALCEEIYGELYG